MSGKPVGLATLPEDPRARLGIAALHACIVATEHWDHLGRAERHALIRAAASASGQAPALPTTIHRSTRTALVGHRMAYFDHSDGAALLVTELGRRVTAWALWLARGESLDTLLDGGSA